ncbi:MAG: type I methionyl aminopeptidase [Candidatus Paracaedibacteraceae bacterium]|nr:type I methionyl aminopeptidase [Candidatus Paracaedibacteraceae bacterium]
MINPQHHVHSDSCKHSHAEEEQDDSTIVIHNASDFDGMRKAGRLASQLLDYITPFVKAGITTDEINTLCHAWTIERGAVPAPLGYAPYGHIPFPKSVCTSVNHVVCHGIPSDKRLVTGDIINIDVTLIVDGWHGDTSRMFSIGKVPLRAEKLINVTYECLMRAIDIVKPGTTLGDIGHVIQSHAEKSGFSVVRDFCGHGLGRSFHSAPSIVHYGKPGEGIALKEGMFFTIEPMINAGKYNIKMLDDGWTAVTRDRSLSAQFEHTLGVTANGVEIFTA